MLPPRRISLAMLVACLAVILPSMVSAKSSTVAREVFGEVTTAAIRGANDVELQRIAPRSFEQTKVGDPKRFGGYQVLGPPTRLGADFVTRLAALLFADASYVRNIDKFFCAQDVLLGARFGEGAEQVDLLFMFPCNRVAIIRRPSGDPTINPGEYFDPAARAFAAFFKGALPRDAAVQALR